MAHITTVDVTNGVPTAGSGTVYTIDALMALIGEVQASPTANTELDRLKALNTSLQQLVTALGSTPLDLGSGTGGTRTIRTIVDSSQLAALATAYDALNNAGGGQKVYLPTDQPVPNKVQSQANGTTAARVNAAASTNATNLKASAGAITNIDVFNVAAYDVFLKLYNKASAPTVGTDTPVWTIPVKAGTGFSRHFQYGKWFATGVSYAITKLQADSDTTVVVAGDLTGSIDWI